MSEEDFKEFRWRLKTIGSVYHHDLAWRKVFESYDLEWRDWWGKYCQGMHNLVGNFIDDKNEDRGRMSLTSIFDEKGEDLFIRWLLWGKREDIVPFYEWFGRAMNSRREEDQHKKEQEAVRQEEELVGYVYLLKADCRPRRYKIGVGKTKERAESVITACPFETIVVYQEEVKDPYRIEQGLHEKFDDKRVKGEWFELGQKNVEEIKKLLNEKKEN